MNNFYVQDGQFWLNHQPQFIQAGEFHYFRTPPDQWAHRLGLLLAAGFNTVATYIPWLWHQLEEGVSDFDGRSHPQRNLAGFLDLAAAMGLWIIARPGPYIMAETINEGIPPWVFHNYPQVAFISQEQKTQNIASYLHPDFLACVRQWYQAVFAVLTPRQVTRGGQIIMVQLDNEMGMIPWVRNIMDTNPDTLSRFAAYLGERHGRHLSTRYPTDDLVRFLRQNIQQPTEPAAAQVVTDYRHFYREYLREYTAWLWAAARANGIDVLPIINIHGFANGGKTFPIGLSQLVKAMEIEGMVSATDVYPIFIDEGNFHQLLLVNEMTKALHNPGQALFSIEFQAGGNNDFGTGQTSLYDLHSRLCISTGMRAINHYLFCDGENDPLLSPVKRHDWGHPVRKDGTLRRHYHRYAKLSQVLAAYGQDLIAARPYTTTTIGFLLDHFMTEVNNAFTQEATNILTHQREVILFDLIARGLALTHRPFNAIELSRGALDVSQTPVLWVMMDKQCPTAVQQKLVDYVQQGGRLVLIGRLCVADFDHTPYTILQDALDITHLESDPPFVPRRLRIFSYQDVPVSFVETYTGEFDEIFAADENGAVAGFVKTMGQGQVMMLAAALTANTLEDLDIVHQMALKMSCYPLFQLGESDCSEMEGWADVHLSHGQNGTFLFINNYQDDPVDTTIACQNEKLFSGNKVQLPARAGLILPLDWQLTKGVIIHYVTSEITGITEDGASLIVTTRQNEFFAEMTLSGYSCDQVAILTRSAAAQRIRVQGKTGVIVLTPL
ncbi:MAG: glycoside hydrolase [Chloroflexi bacterium]|nr:beta-galactosidase [Ardenticatenaceae bacterium]MBL1129764.1 glycoside hydrolase [Chloroflexota bacterium]NOG35848.1 glycoside hydrolase [Chloroflexota bacterium]GIK55468.1 MAG: glycoside hydrolase [Chloroflexota bacterium]